MAKKPNRLATLREAFEKSDADNDKGVKEEGKADKKRDAKELPAFLKKKKGGS